MRQIPLDVSLSEYMTFETFYLGPNKSVVDSLRDEKNQLIWLAGLEGFGKTHLLHAFLNSHEHENKKVLYLPMSESQDFTPDILDNLAQYDLVAIDDIENIIGDMTWEEQLLKFYEDSYSTRNKILITANDTPKGLNFLLPDLSSRFNLALIERLRPMNEDEMIKAILIHSKARGFDLPEDSAKYLINRVPRDVSVLVDMIKLLDYESLSMQRKLTIPFIKTVLDIK
ncbi:MAG: DnaA regulatory inactivator Hda [Gammaproteobacteria bacterium]|nr:DnaA regulatory inactivator Hda [Gammaproteobacteria bacterium]